MKYAFINGIILDGSKDMKPISDMAILTKDNNILAIVENDESFDGYEIIDLKGKYIMPGLINLHVHLPASGKPKKKASDPKKLVRLVKSNFLFKKFAQKLCEKYALMELKSGVTTIRTVGGILDFDSMIRDRIHNNEILGPRILASNMAISVVGGHMAGSLAYEAKSVEDAKYYVQVIAKDKPDLIKLMITGGVLDAKVKGEPGELKMPSAYVKAACEEAHRLGFKVAAHVESSEGVYVALENGVDTIEHGAKVNPEIIQLFKRQNASHIVTLSPALPFALFDRSISNVSEIEQFNGKVVFEGIIDCAKACLENNIPVGLGTDTGCPYVTHYDMYRELVYFHKFCNVSNAFALYTATKRNAQIAGIGDITGSIEVGKCADMIITENNPLDNLEALRNISMVVVKGKILSDIKNKKMQEVEKELDKYL